MKENIKSRLAELRAQMKTQGISAVIVPQADPHMSEYLSSHWQARRMLSGFTGSAGDLVVTLDAALLWTDSRYFLQATQQLDGTEIKLMKDGLPDTPSIAKWLVTTLRPGETVGINGMVFSTVAKEELEMQLNAHGIALNADFDPLDKIWADRPALPSGKAFVHDLKYAGVAAKDKIAATLANAKTQMANSAFISALDEIAWVLNIRSNDVKYNPVVTSFLYLSPEGSVLFIDPAKVDDTLSAYLAAEGVKTVSYSSVKDFIKGIGENEKVLIEGARTAAGIAALLGDRAVKGHRYRR